jgi:hypothetical protein
MSETLKSYDGNIADELNSLNEQINERMQKAEAKIEEAKNANNEAEATKWEGILADDQKLGERVMAMLGKLNTEQPVNMASDADLLTPEQKKEAEKTYAYDAVLVGKDGKEYRIQANSKEEYEEKRRDAFDTNNDIGQ